MKKIALFLLTCCMFLTCCACQGQQQQSDNSTSENTSTADAAPSQETEKVPASIEDELSPVLTEADKANIPIEMARNNIAKTGDRAGVTKSKQWIKTSLDMEMLDTPGVLWPKFEDERTALNLAFTGAIKDEIMDIEELAYKLVERLQEYYPQRLIERFGITEIHENPLDNLDAIARKRGCIMARNEINYNRIAVMLIDEFRGGKLGNISLERPDDVFEEVEVEKKEETEKERKRRIRKEKRNEKKKERR